MTLEKITLRLAYSDFISFPDLTVQAEEELSVKTKLDNFSRVKEARRK